jgi:hypothetical protein
MVPTRSTAKFKKIAQIVLRIPYVYYLNYLIIQVVSPGSGNSPMLSRYTKKVQRKTLKTIDQFPLLA